MIKKIIGIFSIAIISVLLFGCNRALIDLRAQRDANVVAVLESYELALDMTKTDLISEAELMYSTQLQDEWVIIAFERHSGIDREEVANMPLFSVNDFNEISQPYEEATQTRIDEINASYDRFYSELTSNSASIESMNEAIADVEARRAETIKNTTVGIGSAAGAAILVAP